MVSRDNHDRNELLNKIKRAQASKQYSTDSFIQSKLSYGADLSNQPSSHYESKSIPRTFKEVPSNYAEFHEARQIHANDAEETKNFGRLATEYQQIVKDRHRTGNEQYHRGFEPK